MKVLYGSQLIDFKAIETHGSGHVRLRYGYGIDPNGITSYYDQLILRPEQFEVVEATENELRILEEAMEKIPEKVSKPRSKPEVRFWRVEFESPRLPKGSRRVGYVILYRDPFSGAESKAEIMRGGIHDGYLYCKAPYAPSRLFIRFRIKGREFKIQVPIKVKWVPEVVE